MKMHSEFSGSAVLQKSVEDGHVHSLSVHRAILEGRHFLSISDENLEAARASVSC